MLSLHFTLHFREHIHIPVPGDFDNLAEFDKVEPILTGDLFGIECPRPKKALILILAANQCLTVFLSPADCHWNQNLIQRSR